MAATKALTIPFLNKNEILGVTLIFIFLILVSWVNFGISAKRSRDAARMTDLGVVVDALEKYHEEYGFYPPSQDGFVKSCAGKPAINPGILTTLQRNLAYRQFINEKAEACVWGQDSLADIGDPEYPRFLSVLPKDPDPRQTYVYLSDMDNYLIMAAHELNETTSEELKTKNINCGEKSCNFFRTNTTLEKFFEEYDNK